MYAVAATAILAATQVPLSPSASAAGPDSINGSLWRDVNVSGVLGDTDPTQFGASAEGPIAGVQIALADAAGSTISTVTTASDGTFSFDSLPPGNYNLTITYPLGLSPTVLGPDNDVTSSAAPAPGDPWTATAPATLTAGGEVIVHIGARPVAELTIDIADLDPGPGVIPAIETGRPTFDVLGQCATQSDPPVNGDDCSTEDSYVRTNDVVSMTFAVAANNVVDPETAPLQNVIFEQIITPEPGAVVTYDTLPAACETTGVAPASSIVTNTDGTITLLCNLGPFGNELKILTSTIVVDGKSMDGATFTTEQRVYQFDDNAVPPAPLPPVSTEISAAPRFDLTTNNDASNPYNSLIVSSVPVKRTNPETGVEEWGVSYIYDVSAIYDGGAAGQEALAGPINFTDVVDSSYPGWDLHYCSNTAYPSRSLPTNSTPETDFGGKGTWSCTADHAAGTINVEVTGVDTDGTPVPTEGDNGTDLSAGPFIAFDGRIAIWYPYSGFYRSVDPAWTYGDAPILGDYPITNCVASFDPTSTSGISNYGDGVEPGDDGAGTLSGNNCRSHTAVVRENGGFSKQVGSYEWADSRLPGGGSNWPCGANRPAASIDGQTDCGSGDAPIQPGQKLFFWTMIRNGGSIPLDGDAVMLCDAWDNSVFKLTDFTAIGSPFALSLQGDELSADDWVIEFATGGPTAGSTTWENDILVNGVGTDGFFSGDWSNQTQGAATCSTANNDWNSDIEAFDPDPQRSRDLVTMFRVRLADPANVELNPGQGVYVQHAVEVRDTFFGDANQPHVGEPIPIGAKLANMANRQYSTVAGSNGNLLPASSMYDPDANQNTSYGDRVLLNRFQLRLVKTADTTTTGDDTLEQVEAGRQILWSLRPTITAVSDGAVASNVTITDVLPRYVGLDPVCQAAQPLPDGVTLTSVTSGPGEGETTLVFELGDRNTNEPIGFIPICTVADPFAPPSTDVVNSAEITADGDVTSSEFRTAERTVRIVQTGSFTVHKSVDAPLELQNSNQTWTIGWNNLSANLPFGAPDVIDVLPYNGDFGNVNNGRIEFDTVSNPSAAFALTAFLPNPTILTPSGTTTTANGTWFYSNDDPSTISHDPRDARNDLTSGSTNWCSEADIAASGAGCVMALTDITALRWVSDDPLMPNNSASVAFTTAAGTAVAGTATSNDPSDRYVNRFAAFSSTFPNQLVRSNEVLVQVLGMSIGDFIFQDIDVDGAYDPTIDLMLPGVTVELYDSTGALVATTLTDNNGRYIFNDLLAGDYEVRIPAADFATGGPLETLLPTVNAQPANNDNNENVDHSATVFAGGATSGVVSLDPDVSDDPPIGREPNGEDVAGIGDELTYDNLSNLSVDLGFVGPSGIDLTKEVCVLEDTAACDATNDAHWDDDLSTAPTGIPFNSPWRLTVTNTGQQVIRDIAITDSAATECDADATVFAELTQLSPAESFSYVCGSQDLAQDLTNTAVVTATAADGDPLTDTDSAAITAPAANPGLSIIKRVNDEDANTAPGVAVAPASTVTWTYEVTNTGNVAFNALDITDDNGTASDPNDDFTPTFVGGDTNSDGILDLDEVWQFSATGTAVDGQYTNDATATGTGTWDGLTFTRSDNDPANSFGVIASIAIEKSTNGLDADTGDGPHVTFGDTVTWNFQVTNTGNVQLVDVSVTDDKLASTSIDCGAGTNVIAALAPSEVVTCSATATAEAGQHENTATATGSPRDATGAPLTNFPDPTDSDPSHYYGEAGSLLIEKATNGDDADTPGGPKLRTGDAITWTYDVTNNGSVPLLAVTVVDDQGVSISCETHLGDTNNDHIIDVLRPTETVRCSATGTATLGQYRNLGQASGNPVTPVAEGDYDEDLPGSWPEDAIDYVDIADLPDASADDPSHYFGYEGLPGIDVEKSTNTFDADDPAGPYITKDGGVLWRYVVTNSGELALRAVSVTDDRLAATAISCADHRNDTDGDNIVDLLAPGESVVCSATGTAIVVAPNGQYANTATVTGTPVLPVNPGTRFDPAVASTYPSDVSAYEDLTNEEAPSDTDKSHYFSASAADPGVDVEKSTNGDDADTTDGPYLIPGQSTVTWTFDITNTGGYVLANVRLVDDQLASASISCADHLNDTNGDAVIDLLRMGESVRCSATALADTIGRYTNVATVVGEPVAPRNCTGCDPVDSSTWPTDPSAYVPATDADGTELAAATESDPSHYFGAEPGVAIEKSTDGHDADTAPGPYLAVGDTVTWTYAVTNTGNTPLITIEVSDDQVASASIDCGSGSNLVDLLLPGETASCSATGTVTEGQYANTGSVAATPASPTTDGGHRPIIDPATGGDIDPIVDVDPSHYVGLRPELGVEKSTNGVDADSPSGPWLIADDAVTWTYEITNQGNAALRSVTLQDDRLADSELWCPAHHLDDDNDGTIDLLLPGESVTCSATGQAQPNGGYANIASVVGTTANVTKPGTGFDADDPATYPTDPAEYSDVIDPNTGAAVAPVEDSDPSHYFTVAPSVSLTKFVEDDDAELAPGVMVGAGDDVNWRFEVVNDGQIPLVNVAVIDDQVTSVDCGDGTAVIALLMPGETINCTAVSTAVDGAFVNIGKVTGTPAQPTDPAGTDPADPTTWPTDLESWEPIVDPTTGEEESVENTNEAHYFGAAPAIDVEKSVCTEVAVPDCDTDSDVWADEIVFVEGQTITWRVTVTNTGNVDLYHVVVDDPVEPGCDATIGELKAGAVRQFTCSREGATDGYENEATARGTDGLGTSVDDSDTAVVLPGPELAIAKTAGSARAAQGSIVTYTLVVTNEGDGPASEVVIADSLPDGLTYIATDVINAKASSPTYDTAANKVSWEIERLEPGATLTVRYRARVDARDGELVNSVAVRAGQQEAILTNNADEASILARTLNYSQSLAFTGATTLRLVLIAFGLVLAGSATVGYARQRRAM